MLLLRLLSRVELAPLPYFPQIAFFCSVVMEERRSLFQTNEKSVVLD